MKDQRCQRLKTKAKGQKHAKIRRSVEKQNVVAYDEDYLFWYVFNAQTCYTQQLIITQK